MMYFKGDKIRYVGKAYPEIHGLIGIVEDSSPWITQGFIRVSFPGDVHPKTGRQRVRRINQRMVEDAE